MPTGVTLSDTHAAARLAATLADLDDHVSNHAKIRLYNGTRPASGGTPTTMLCELTLSKPAGSISGSPPVLTLTADDSAVCAASGTATWARFISGNGDFSFDCDVSTITAGTGFVQLEDTSLLAGGRVGITLVAIT